MLLGFLHFQGIRRCFGHGAIDVGLMGLDKQLGALDAKSAHVIHPVGYW
ncbi:MAG: hypothetical protein LBC83_04380 [Oscillospiraceae bacterium]|nr:hypothetical protein [Oscillospiraceae bacterium]